jgi:uncharacterized protein
MNFILPAAFFLILILLPQWWVKRVFSQYQIDREDFPGTGGQFAEHILTLFEIEEARIDISPSDNHFDPQSKTVALTPQYFNGKSLTAVTIAAHEIGHLLQQQEGNKWLQLRTSLVLLTKKLERYGIIALFFIPFAGLLTHSPSVVVGLTALGLSGMLVKVLVHLITLPMELDASFGKALPLLLAGKFISKEDEPGVRKILWAAALTYLASALSSLLSLANWLRVLRR